MSQISPPIRIVLVAALAFLAAWMTVLKPKSADTPPAPAAPGNVHTNAPAVSAPGKAVEKAQDAVSKANARSAADEAATGEGDTATGAAGTTTTSPGTGTGTPSATTAGKGALAGVPKPIARAIAKQKVVVELFWNPRSADDRQVHAALRGVDRWGGRVYVDAAPIEKISRYGRIARGVDVQQSPTVVVVDRTLDATPLVGYVDTRTIDQAVLDALRNSGGQFVSDYLRAVNRVCDGTPALAHPADASATRWHRFVHELAAVDAPKRWKRFDAAMLADARTMRTTGAARASFSKRMRAHHVYACVAG